MKRALGEYRPVPLRLRLVWGAAAGSLAGAIVGLLVRLGPLEGFEQQTLNWRFQWLARPTAALDRVAVALIDNESVEAFKAEDPTLGWPWPREFQAAMVRFLKAAGARAVVFDVLFLDDSRLGADDDRGFAKEIAAAGNVILAAKLEDGEPDTAAPYLERSAVEMEGWTFTGREGLARLLPPLPALAEAAAGLGIINIDPDGDGSLRRADLVFRHGERLLPSLAMAAALAAMGGERRARVEGRWLRLGGGELPLEPYDGRLLVRYYGTERTVPTHQAEKLVRAGANLGDEEAADRADFKDRVVFVGVRMAAGLSVEGSGIQTDPQANAAFYRIRGGRAEDVLTLRAVPESAARLKELLARLSAPATPDPLRTPVLLPPVAVPPRPPLPPAPPPPPDK